MQPAQPAGDLMRLEGFRSQTGHSRKRVRDGSSSPSMLLEGIDCCVQCDYCPSSIASGRRWVRETNQQFCIRIDLHGPVLIYDPAHDGHDASYRGYHVEPFAAQDESC